MVGGARGLMTTRRAPCFVLASFMQGVYVGQQRMAKGRSGSGGGRAASTKHNQGLRT